jgi:hypothetical protein
MWKIKWKFHVHFLSFWENIIGIFITSFKYNRTFLVAIRSRIYLESLKGTWDGPKEKAHIQIIKSDCPSMEILRKFVWISLENQINLHIILQYL